MSDPISDSFTDAQKVLAQKHGTPAEFAKACYSCVPGAISMEEAEIAIKKYQLDWDDAGQPEQSKSEVAAPQEVLPSRMEDMNEPQLRQHFNLLMRTIGNLQPEDVIGSMLITFMDNGITQYAASVDPETVPAALRELADRIERRETVKR